MGEGREGGRKEAGTEADRKVETWMDGGSKEKGVGVHGNGFV